MSESLLIQEPPLQVLPSLAAKIGLNNAIFLQQLHYWLLIAKNGKLRRKSDTAWIYNSAESWRDNFPFWSVPTIKRITKELREMGLIVTEQRSKDSRDKTNWFRINYDKLEMLKNPNVFPSDQIDTMQGVNLIRCYKEQRLLQREQAFASYDENESGGKNGQPEDRKSVV